MKSFRCFEEIEGWKKARELTREVYSVSGKGHFNADYGLPDQMRRAAVSIMSNIAEGGRTGRERRVPAVSFHGKGFYR
jgi:four helix bundle protein